MKQEKLSPFQLMSFNSQNELLSHKYTEIWTFGRYLIENVENFDSFIFLICGNRDFENFLFK